MLAIPRSSTLRADLALLSATASQVSERKDFSKLVASGTFGTGPHRDWTVAVDVAGLQPGRRYYYSFSCGKQHRWASADGSAGAVAASKGQDCRDLQPGTHPQPQRDRHHQDGGQRPNRAAHLCHCFVRQLVSACVDGRCCHRSKSLMLAAHPAAFHLTTVQGLW